MEEKKKVSGVPFAVYLLLPLLFFSGVLVGDRVDIKSLLRKDASSQNSGAELDYSSVSEAYTTLIENYDGKLDNGKLLDGLKKGLTNATEDPYTEYFSVEESKSFNEQITGSFTGIGAELAKDNGVIVVTTPLRGHPAEKAGVLARDVIAKIDDADALSMSVQDAVKKIRGPKDTTVKLTLLRGTEQIEVSIVRADIKIPSVEYSVLDGGVCSIVISRFSDDTDSLVKEASKSCKEKGTNMVLVDLRNNPGGYLEQAIKVASHWVEDGKNVVSEKRGGKVIKTHPAQYGQDFAGMKTVVLINEGSASASEILAGALKDYGLAILVGKKSYGKGSVQEVDPLTGGASIKITIARWYTPNDKNIDKQGIEPDEKVDITVDQIKAGQDPQKAKALELLK